MQVNPLFGHEHVIVQIQVDDDVPHTASKIFWSSLAAFILLNVFGILVAYLVTKSFDDWFTIACMCTTIIGIIIFISCCIHHCFCTCRRSAH